MVSIFLDGNVRIQQAYITVFNLFLLQSLNSDQDESANVSNLEEDFIIISSALLGFEDEPELDPASGNQHDQQVADGRMYVVKSFMIVVI
jgi:hypothetical protein